MSDHDAIDAITEVLERLYEGGMYDHDALTAIERIIGANKIEHEEAKEEQS